MTTTALTLAFGLSAISTGSMVILLQLQLNKATKQLAKLDGAREATAAALGNQIKIDQNLLKLMTQTDERLTRLELKGANH